MSTIELGATVSHPTYGRGVVVAVYPYDRRTVGVLFSDAERDIPIRSLTHVGAA